MVALLMTRLPEIANSSRKPYPSDLSDAEWEILKQVLPKPKALDIPRKLISGRFSTTSSMSNARDVNGK